MSLVERLRRMVGSERAEGGAHPYQCQNCGESFELQRQSCPRCGCYRIDRAVWNDRIK